MNALIITNNSLVRERLGGLYQVDHEDVSYRQVLVKVRDLVHKGHHLYSHPLSGSLKPNETPYKSVLLSARPEGFSEESLGVIETGLAVCDQFPERAGEWSGAVKGDFRLIDYELISNSVKGRCLK